MVERFANWYGMEKQTDPQLDDWKAFFSIQLARYLEKKSTRKLGTVAERDMITDLIYDYWKELKKSGILEEKEYGEKLDIFKEVEIIFPSLVVPDEGKNQPIPVDFRRKQHVNSTDRCHCGSGLPYSVCCGRTPGLDELECGIF
jgi:protein-disulfide isomerase-like protein with CxxC motif